MDKVSFLHTHYLPPRLLNDYLIDTSVIAIEMYPDLLLSYYGDYDVFDSLEDAISWHSDQYEGQSVKFTIENIAILKDPRSLKKTKDLGLAVVQLFHSNSSSYYDKSMGVTSEGCHLLRKIQENDLILDLSHLDDNGINQVMNLYSGKVIISHCVCRELVETIHPRTNTISKETIKLLSDRGCLFGIPFVNDLVSSISHDTNENDDGIIKDIISQLLFFVNYAGAENVSLGPDFMDMNYFSKVFGQDIRIPNSLYEVAGYDELMRALKRHNLSDNEVKSIMNENVKRILEI